MQPKKGLILLARLAELVAILITLEFVVVNIEQFLQIHSNLQWQSEHSRNPHW